MLLGRGDEVVCVVRKPNLCLDGLPVTLSTAPLGDADALARAAEGCDGVFHVAGTFDPGPGGEALMRSLHVDGTQAVLRAATLAGVPKVLVCSSSITCGYGPREAPGDEETPLDPGKVYGRSGALRAYHDTKLESEALARTWGAVVVNPDYVLGAWDVKPTSGQLLLSIAKGRMFVYPRGGKTFVDAVDCAWGHVFALERGQPGRRYLLANESLSYREFMGRCATIAGVRPPILPVPDLALGLLGRVGGVLQARDPHRFAGLEPHLLGAMREGRYRSGRRAQTELGVPTTPIEGSIQSALQWFREHGYLDGGRRG